MIQLLFSHSISARLVLGVVHLVGSAAIANVLPINSGKSRTLDQSGPIKFLSGSTADKGFSHLKSRIQGLKEKISSGRAVHVGPSSHTTLHADSLALGELDATGTQLEVSTFRIPLAESSEPTLETFVVPVRETSHGRNLDVRLQTRGLDVIERNDKDQFERSFRVAEDISGAPAVRMQTLSRKTTTLSEVPRRQVELVITRDVALDKPGKIQIRMVSPSENPGPDSKTKIYTLTNTEMRGALPVYFEPVSNDKVAVYLWSNHQQTDSTSPVQNIQKVIFNLTDQRVNTPGSNDPDTYLIRPDGQPTTLSAAEVKKLSIFHGADLRHFSRRNTKPEGAQVLSFPTSKGSTDGPSGRTGSGAHGVGRTGGTE